MQELVIFLLGLALGSVAGAAGIYILRFVSPTLLQRFLAARMPRKRGSAALDVQDAASAPPPVTQTDPDPELAAAGNPEPEPLAAESALALEPEPQAAKEEGGRDKRKYVRLAIEDPLLVTPFAGREIMAEICDVSLGGMRFRVVGLALREGDMMHVTFELSGESVSAVARVLRTRRVDDVTTEVASEFARLDPWAARRFEEALAEEA